MQKVLGDDPKFFETLAKSQSPGTLWIGCADSRVPETTILDSKPGDIFVHRNIANVVKADDLSSGSVIEYGVGNLKVKRIIICGHTRCGGAIAALGDADLGKTLNAWLAPLRELRRRHQAELNKLATEDEKALKLAELNVLRGLDVLRNNPIVQEAMHERGLTIHGTIFNLGSGELRALEDKKDAPKLWSPS